jgi:hypothetical protein
MKPVVQKPHVATGVDLGTGGVDLGMWDAMLGKWTSPNFSQIFTGKSVAQPNNRNVITIKGLSLFNYQSNDDASSHIPSSNQETPPVVPHVRPS